MFTAQSPANIPTKEQLLSLSGLEFMQGIRDGTIPGPPIAKVLNYRVDTVEKGHVVFRGTPLFDHCNPMGGTHGGWYGTLLDSCMACAVMTMLPRGQIYTTLEYKVNLIRAIPTGTEILAIGQIDHCGRSTAVAHGEIRGATDDRLYATGTTTCLVMAPNAQT